MKKANIDPTFVRAALEALSSITPHQRQFVEQLYKSNEHEASGSQLAASLGVKSFIVANGAIGKVGRKVFDKLGYHPDRLTEGAFEWWTVIATGRKTLEDFRWTLRPEVVCALNELHPEWLPAQSDTGESGEPPEGVRHPLSRTVQRIEYFRNLAVANWVMGCASGLCECCKQPAPFSTSDGPYLEVHHVRRLADEGSDMHTNAVAVCPNCHRRLHFGHDAAQLVERLYLQVNRLVRE